MRDQESIGGSLWNPFSRNQISVTGLQAPLKKIDFFTLHEALDHITAAVESGGLRQSTWPEQLFATEKVFHDFLGALSTYDQCFRIVDRWWCALADLIDYVDEEGFIHTQDMASEIELAYTRLLKTHPQWQKKSAKKAAASKRKVAA